MDFMRAGPTTSWEIDGKTVETVSDFIFLGSKITAFFNFNLNLAIRSSWSEPQSAPGLVFADCKEMGIPDRVGSRTTHQAELQRLSGPYGPSATG